MRAIHTEIGMLAPAPVVWEVLTDFEGWRRWNPFLRATGRPEPGAKLEVVIAPPGRRPVTMRPRVVRLEEGRELRWKGHLWIPGLFDGEHGFRVVPEEAGRCRFEQFETFTGLLARPILARVGKATETGFTAMNRALKREAERLAAERARNA